MLSFLQRLNDFFKNLLLEDVDKTQDGPLPYHKGFRANNSYKKHKEKLNRKRNLEQHEQNRGF